MMATRVSRGPAFTNISRFIIQGSNIQTAATPLGPNGNAHGGWEKAVKRPMTDRHDDVAGSSTGRA